MDCSKAKKCSIRTFSFELRQKFPTAIGQNWVVVGCRGILGALVLAKLLDFKDDKTSGVVAYTCYFST